MFINAGPIIKLCAGVCVCVCVFITAGPIIKLCAGGEGQAGGKKHKCGLPQAGDFYYSTN